MKYLDKREMHVSHPSITLMCPKCYATLLLGKVSCDVTIESQLPIPRDVNLNAPALLTYPVFGLQMLNNQSMITADCPNCHTTMIALDTGIAPYVRALNVNGLYTENSCWGHRGKNGSLALPYIGFINKAPDTLAEAMQQALSAKAITSEGIDKFKITNDDEHKFAIHAHSRELIIHAVNVLLDDTTPGIAEFKEINKQFHVESLYDLILIEQE